MYVFVETRGVSSDDNIWSSLGIFVFLGCLAVGVGKLLSVSLDDRALALSYVCVLCRDFSEVWTQKQSQGSVDLRKE